MRDAEVAQKVGSTETEFRQFRDTKFFGSLDGLRALAILTVIWHHGYSGHLIPDNLFGRGFHGVGLFFAISGFLITTLLLRERDRNGRLDYRAFFLRRALRIFPLYYAILGVYVVLILALPGDAGRKQAFLDNLPFHLCYLSNWCPPGPFSFAWSLATEEQFYLVWPWVMILLPGRWPLGVALFLWGARFVVYQAVNLEALDDRWFPGLFLRKMSDFILAGIVLAWLLHHPRSHAVLRRVLGFSWAPLAYGGFCLVVLNSPFQHVEYGILAPTFALLIGSAVIREDHAAAKILSFGLLTRIGIVSYGMYLMHIIFLSGIARFADDELPQGSLARFAVAATLTFIAASVSYRFFETPFLRLKSRFSR